MAVAFTLRRAVAAGVVTGRRDAGVVGSTGTLVSATRGVQGDPLQYGKVIREVVYSSFLLVWRVRRTRGGTRRPTTVQYSTR